MTIILTADAEALFNCYDANNRAIGPAQPLKAQVSSLGSFTADSDGNLQGSLTLHPPPPTGLGCGPGLKLLAAGAVFSGGQFSDVTDKVAGTVSGQGGRIPGV